jgi:hypothetical protein
MVQRAIAGSVAGNGLSEVFTDIFTAGDGAQIYVTNLSLWPWLAGQTFEQISHLFPDSVVMGWMAEQNGEWSVDIVPPNSAVASLDMKLVMLASKKNMACSRNQPKIVALDGQSKTKDRSCVALARSQKHVKQVLAMNVVDGNTYLTDRISKGGDKVTPITFSKCQEISLVQLKALGVLNMDTVVLQSFRDDDGKVSDDSDARMITACTMMKLLRQQQSASGKTAPPLHIVAIMSRAESVALLATACGEGMSVEVLNSNEVEAGAIVQMLCTPLLKPVYTSLLEAGSDLFLIPAHLMVPMGQPLSFYQISQEALRRKAVAMGVRRANGSFELAPTKRAKITLNEGDEIIVVADFE